MRVTAGGSQQGVMGGATLGSSYAKVAGPLGQVRGLLTRVHVTYPAGSNPAEPSLGWGAVAGYKGSPAVQASPLWLRI